MADDAKLGTLFAQTIRGPAWSELESRLQAIETSTQALSLLIQRSAERAERATQDAEVLLARLGPQADAAVPVVRLFNLATNQMNPLARAGQMVSPETVPLGPAVLTLNLHCSVDSPDPSMMRHVVRVIVRQGPLVIVEREFIQSTMYLSGTSQWQHPLSIGFTSSGERLTVDIQRQADALARVETTGYILSIHTP